MQVFAHLFEKKILLFLFESLFGRGLIPRHQKNPRVQKWRVEITKKDDNFFRMSFIRKIVPKLRRCCKNIPRLSNVIPD